MATNPFNGLYELSPEYPRGFNSSLSFITPFTHRTNISYAELLFELYKWLREKHIPELDEILDNFHNQYKEDFETLKNDIQSTKTDWENLFNQFMADIENQMEVISDQAIANLIRNETSKLREALNENFHPLDVFHSDNYNSLTELFADADAQGNCIIKIRPGTYNTNTLTLTKSQITIEASGAHIILNDNANSDLLRIEQDALNINVLGGRWDGNKANNTAGHVVHFVEYVGAFRVADRSNLDRCELLNAPQNAWHVGRRRVEIKALRCQIRDAGNYGVYYGGTDCVFQNGAIGLCNVAGVWNANIGNWIVNNGIYDNGVGVRLTEGSRASLTMGNMIDGNLTHGLHIEGTSASRNMDAVVSGNLFLSNSKSSNGMYSDIYTSFANTVTLTGNIGSKKVSAVALPKHAVEVGLGSGLVIATGNYWEPVGYTSTVFNDNTKVSSTSNRYDSRNAIIADSAFTAYVGDEAQPRFRARADGALGWGVGGDIQTDVNLYRGGDNLLKTDDQFQAQRLLLGGVEGNGFIEMLTQTSQPGAVAGRARVFTQSVGGKEQLCVRFGTGAVQVIATEP